MLRRTVGSAIAAVVSIVAVPYAVALLTNILHGWPLGPRRYQRAFHPRKVLALNWSLIGRITGVRYLALALRWKRFYQKATKERLIRDRQYGVNGNYLDVYFPVKQCGAETDTSGKTQSPRPIVIFIYGGSWGSGDKDMYGLLCSQLADHLSAVVLCPNYSIYPKGFVDDMVQDVSDAVAFAHNCAHEFSADKDRIVLIGHSAGAHLAVMTALELSLKQISDNPDMFAEETTALVQRSHSLELSILDDSSSGALFTSQIPLEMHETHFNGDNNENDQRESNNGATSVSGLALSSYLVVEKADQDSTDSEKPLPDSAGGDAQSVAAETAELLPAVSESFYVVADSSTSAAAGESVEPQIVVSEASVAESIVELNPSDTTVESEPLSESQVPSAEVVESVQPTPLKLNKEWDLLSCLRLIIGLAGPYDIAAHYEHEMTRGIEDISMMARAMYGPKQFARFSPTIVVQSLPQNAKLPPIHLIHGSVDQTVPMSSSTIFGNTVWKRSNSPVTATIVNDCNHIDICLDLMEPGRRWHDVVLGEIMRAFDQHVRV